MNRHRVSGFLGSLATLATLVGCATSPNLSNTSSAPARVQFSAGNDYKFRYSILQDLGRIHESPQEVVALDQYLGSIPDDQNPKALVDALLIVPPVSYIQHLRSQNWSFEKIAKLLRNEIELVDLNRLDVLHEANVSPDSAIKYFKECPRSRRTAFGGFTPEYLQRVLSANVSLDTLTKYTDSFSTLVKPHPELLSILEQQKVSPEYAKSLFRNRSISTMGTPGRWNNDDVTYARRLLREGYSLPDIMRFRRGDSFMLVKQPIILNTILNYREAGFSRVNEILSLNAMKVRGSYAKRARAMDQTLSAQDIGFASRFGVSLSGDTSNSYALLKSRGLSLDSLHAVKRGCSLDDLVKVRDTFGLRHFATLSNDQIKFLVGAATEKLDFSNYAPVFVYYASSDWNASACRTPAMFESAFKGRNGTKKASLKKPVALFYSGSSESDLVRAANHFCKITKQKIRNGALHGHANPRVLDLGGDGKEVSEIDPNDSDLFSSLKPYFASDAHVWFMSCSLGRGHGPLAQYIANGLGVKCEGALYSVSIDSVAWDFTKNRLSINYNAGGEKPPFSKTFVPNQTANKR